MKALFFSGCAPPSIGGIQVQNAALAHWLPRQGIAVDLLSNRAGPWALPAFWIYTAGTGRKHGRDYDLVVLGDAWLAPAGWAIKRRHPHLPVAAIVHGLDVTFPLLLYREIWVRRCLPHLDLLIAVSSATMETLRRAGFPLEKLVCIPNGVELPSVAPAPHAVERLVPAAARGQRLLLTVGRLVERKGVAWFIREVMPLLPAHVVYLVAGDGPHRGSVERAIEEAGLQQRVFLLGEVSHADKLALLRACDLFVQPNVPVEGDIEGFCIAVLEAGLAGLPVVASRLEGLTQSIQDGVNGVLVEPQNAVACATAITTLLNDAAAAAELGNRARQWNTEQYGWLQVAARYAKVLGRLVGQSGN